MTLAPLRGMRAAFIFMTRIPLGGFPYSANDFRWAAAHFPLVGLAIGGIGSIPLFFASQLGFLLAAVLSLSLTVWFTGAFHEDGLADTADALGGAHSRKKIHEILKDSRIGTYGGTALCLSLFIRSAALGELLARSAPHAPLMIPLLFTMIHVLARTGPVGLMASLNYVAGEGAKGSSVAAGGGIQLLVAILWVVASVAGLMLWGVQLKLLASLIAITFIVSLVFRFWFKSRLGGFTGDFLGATEQAIEISLLVGALLLERIGFLAS